MFFNIFEEKMHLIACLKYHEKCLLTKSSQTMLMNESSLLLPLSLFCRPLFLNALCLGIHSISRLVHLFLPILAI